eukprot:CAMPEP_0113307650 /NCGR_PEP_ID=MMETSP0010_2-20120614/6413_1 /TAXON_ID=216773 ORGANISM="Corethron hystrix, Strain 308" /NCGR_SAMPLE_ID=MMETSP0010_2 /ASSEMBLY_ACC=CAM_ASM_000155 /LENGTH=79 /DNA_ID=CAMNT_0000162553 /DNA_START=60 /DNA_END=299 /DNA_ORIENTATION=+ /assembly_acc=CAM_ASM_000155
MKTFIATFLALAAASASVSAFTFTNTRFFGAVSKSKIFSEEPGNAEPEPEPEPEPVKDYSKMSLEELAHDALGEAGLLK